MATEKVMESSPPFLQSGDKPRIPQTTRQTTDWFSAARRAARLNSLGVSAVVVLHFDVDDEGRSQGRCLAFRGDYYDLLKAYSYSPVKGTGVTSGDLSL